MKATKQQQEWYEEGKCHVCGKDTYHTHHNWMWLANPIPKEDKSKPIPYSEARQAIIEEMEDINNISALSKPITEERIAKCIELMKLNGYKVTE